MSTRFNPRLRKWLNDRDYTTGDWPDNVSVAVKRSADVAVGEGRVLDSFGWPIVAGVRGDDTCGGTWTYHVVAGRIVVLPDSPEVWRAWRERVERTRDACAEITASVKRRVSHG